ncbi:type II toxin-antitoxin system Phd/YefM family antitoxin [Quisquiliibacterium transsilvanicum]|uniref:Antitoxin (DNA-binding transcriptional repressor) of toxin-antitoxin stability system n=1 Tax=Quisquiliibacterium transsilvanicum TaxID=1549638 RepID=A0A7W8M6Z4_9BURK|nr:type II toxin-antitoxin system Phd/YefM family antitoxin [Quisquiliibacterium transsilvanicum]MBB5270193.1 antitoxin (DNA-binding transcriptional repressor) of toxin-antitoxin stability system [Quisquiliibacterium transsilvanicum]
MKAVNIRQLKTNPSTALAAAHEDDMVVVMNRDKPQALLVDLEQLGVADKPLAEMLTLLSSLGLPLTGEGKAAADEAREEMRRARDWLLKRSA